MPKITKEQFMALPKIADRLSKMPLIDVIECTDDCEHENCQGWILGYKDGD